MFHHWKDGWYFIRHDDGSVTIDKRESAHADAETVVIANINADEWASIVAAVSALGETEGRWQHARDFHKGVI